jgi:hypothetical protein
MERSTLGEEILQMIIRKSSFFLCFIAIAIVCFLAMMIHASLLEKRNAHILRMKAEMVRTLALTDLCIFTEASYTRHLSLMDTHTPFKDLPVSLEHFPSGALVMPSPVLRRPYEKLD